MVEDEVKYLGAEGAEPWTPRPAEAVLEGARPAWEPEAHTDDYIAKPEREPEPDEPVLHTRPHGVADGIHCPKCWEGFPDHPPLTVWDEKPREGGVIEGCCVTAMQMDAHAGLDEHDVALFLTDRLMNPLHYARWKMEPVEFIAINDLPWWMANVIKYIMRFDAKDGLKDLYKARSYLEMIIRKMEGVERWWEKPVAEERKLNDPSTQITRKG